MKYDKSWDERWIWIKKFLVKIIEILIIFLVWFVYVFLKIKLLICEYAINWWGLRIVREKFKGW